MGIYYEDDEPDKVCCEVEPVVIIRGNNYCEDCFRRILIDIQAGIEKVLEDNGVPKSYGEYLTEDLMERLEKDS